MLTHTLCCFHLFRQLLLKLASWLCNNYESNHKAKRIVDEMHLFLMPTMNPDGYKSWRRENGSVAQFCILSLADFKLMVFEGPELFIRRRCCLSRGKISGCRYAYYLVVYYQFRHNVDLNRNFPDRNHQHEVPLVPTGKEEAETLALMHWMERVPFVASASLHEGALVANYPWDASDDRSRGYAASPDDNTFVYISKLYASHHRQMSKSQV